MSLREYEAMVNKSVAYGVDLYTSQHITLNQMYEKYMSLKSGLRDGTRENYMYIYDHFVKDEIGRVPILDIKFSSIKAFYNMLLTVKGIKFNSLGNIHTILHPIFELAINDGLRFTNPTKGVIKELKHEHGWTTPKRHALTVDEQAAFVNFIASSPQYVRWKLIFTVLLGTGLRIGECLGLCWSDVNFKQKTLSINRTLSYRKDSKTETCSYHIGKPKTASGFRQIPLHSDVLAAFEKERESQRLFGGNDCIVDGQGGFIFFNRTHSMLSPAMVNRALSRIIRDYNKAEMNRTDIKSEDKVFLPHFTCHNLRHTFATRACEAEMSVKTLQSILGHADITTTMNVYAEAQECNNKRIFEAIEDKIIIA